MPVRPLAALSAVVCMLVLPHTGFATQLYKWVDERGVTNYSDQPPSATVKKQGVIENRVSVYTPDPLLVRAVEAERARAIEDLRTSRRARDLQADWLARQYLAAAYAQSADPCAGSADPRCTGYAPHGHVPAVFVASRRVPRILPQIDLAPGTTAGNVTAGAAFIPGHSASAPRVSSSAPRAVLEAARSGGADAGVPAPSGRKR